MPNYLELLKEIDARAESLTGKEIEFVEDMLEKFTSAQGNGRVSPKQAQWIEDLHETHVINRGVRHV